MCRSASVLQPRCHSERSEESVFFFYGYYGLRRLRLAMTAWFCVQPTGGRGRPPLQSLKSIIHNGRGQSPSPTDNYGRCFVVAIYRRRRLSIFYVYVTYWVFPYVGICRGWRPRHPANKPSSEFSFYSLRHFASQKSTAQTEGG